MHADISQLEDKTKAVAKKLLKAKKLKQRADELVNSSHKLGNVSPYLSHLPTYIKSDSSACPTSTRTTVASTTATVTH